MNEQKQMTVAQWNAAILGQETKEDREAVFALWRQEMVERIAAIYRPLYDQMGKDTPKN